MTVASVACTNCGKNFTTDELRLTHCRYCGTLLAHHARAAQQVAVVNEMLADRNGNGIPDAFEGLAANAQANAMRQAFGPPNPYAPPGMPPAMHMQGQAMQIGQQVGRQVAVATNLVLMIVLASIAFAILLTIGIGVLVFALR